MIVSTIDLKSMPEFSEYSERELRRKVAAAEAKIRAYTHNDFTNPAVRFKSSVIGGRLACESVYVDVGDSIKLSECGVNNGIYEVLAKDGDFAELDNRIYDCGHVLVTKVEYPQDVIEGCISMLKYDAERRGKEGVQSETISRHSVTYFDASQTNQAVGYPISLIAFLKPYMKARF